MNWPFTKFNTYFLIVIATAVLQSGCDPEYSNTYGPYKSKIVTGLASTNKGIAVSDTLGQVHLYKNRNWITLHEIPFVIRVWEAGVYTLFETDKREVFYGKDPEKLEEEIKVEGKIISSGPCQKGFFVLTNVKLYILQEGITLKRDQSHFRPKDAECTEKGVYLATEGKGILFCPFAGKGCSKALDAPKTSEHTRVIRYVPELKSLLVAVWGDHNDSLVYNNGKLLPTGDEQQKSHVSRDTEIIFLTRSQKMPYPLAISNKGALFQYEDGKYKELPIKGIDMTGLVEYGGKYFGFVNNNLSQIDINSKTIVAVPLDLQPPLGITELPIGNTFVEDFTSTPNGTLFAATNDAGIWISLDDGEHWFPFIEGLPAHSKIHFVEYLSVSNKIFAGEHHTGIYFCDIPCAQWEPFLSDKLSPKKGLLLDPQDAIQTSDSMIVATESGLFSLSEDGVLRIDETEPPVDFFRLTRDSQNNVYAGAYFKIHRPGGVWKITPSGIEHILEGFDVPIRGLTFLGENLIVATIDTLNSCFEKKCTEVLDYYLPINGVTVVDDTIWIATESGLGYISDIESQEIKWISDIPTERVEYMSGVLLVGTRVNGIKRVLL